MQYVTPGFLVGLVIGFILGILVGVIFFADDADAAARTAWAVAGVVA